MAKSPKRKPPDRIQKWSEDYDKSKVITAVFIVFGSFLGCVVALELYSLIADKQRTYLSPEILHTIVGFIGGWCGNIVTNLFLEHMAKQAVKNGNQAAHNIQALAETPRSPAAENTVKAAAEEPENIDENTAIQQLLNEMEGEKPAA